MLGVVFAAGAMGMSVYTGSHIPDALGSIAIGGLLGGVATFMIVTNTNSLVGKSIPEEKINSINEELEGETTMPEGQIILAPHRKNSSSVPPSNSLVSVSDP